MSGLARKLAVLSAGTAMLATMTAGLLASPAAAASGSTQARASAAHGVPKAAVSVGAPKASPSKSTDCPVKVTFSSKIKVKAYGGRTTVAYRWLRGDGSKSGIKKVTLKGKGVKYVAVKESATFKGGDLKSWNSVQVLAPRKVTSAKGYFTVACGEDKGDGGKEEVVKPRPHRHWTATRVWVDERDCKAVATGRISTSGKRWVRYQWVVNGRVVDRDSVYVNGSRRVQYVIEPGRDLRGQVRLEVVGRGGSSDGSYFRIHCEDHSPKVTASVAAPADYSGTCPVTRTFSGTIRVSDADGPVRYRWIRDGVAGSWETVSFYGHGPQSRTLTDSWKASESGTARRAIEIAGGPTSGTASAKVACEAAPAPKAYISKFTASQTEVACSRASLAVSGTIYAEGAMKVKYVLKVNGATVKSGELDFASAGSQEVAYGADSIGTKSGTATLEIVGGGNASASYEAVCKA
ncbi:hypothetical protein GCM10027187_19610 [Streptosporangium sandarakinum]|uniref:Ig-like domain-containing protein n=1 Tax=Streptosporangium sandarakinum TaxID=1260955 RepID=A0A852V8M4_9ACTN|nr:hypothetical protein [Streptosporangium sandarakinum]NYF42781.1 hypothetical protein [Streptosporangium sandarakinum]